MELEKEVFKINYILEYFSKKWFVKIYMEDTNLDNDLRDLYGLILMNNEFYFTMDILVSLKRLTDLSIYLNQYFKSIQVRKVPIVPAYSFDKMKTLSNLKSIIPIKCHFLLIYDENFCLNVISNSKKLIHEIVEIINENFIEIEIEFPKNICYNKKSDKWNNFLLELTENYEPIKIFIKRRRIICTILNKFRHSYKYSFEQFFKKFSKKIFQFPYNEYFNQESNLIKSKDELDLDISLIFNNINKNDNINHKISIEVIGESENIEKYRQFLLCKELKSNYSTHSTRTLYHENQINLIKLFKKSFISSNSSEIMNFDMNFELSDFNEFMVNHNTCSFSISHQLDMNKDNSWIIFQNTDFNYLKTLSNNKIIFVTSEENKLPCLILQDHEKNVSYLLENSSEINNDKLFQYILEVDSQGINCLNIPIFLKCANSLEEENQMNNLFQLIMTTLFMRYGKNINEFKSLRVIRIIAKDEQQIDKYLPKIFESVKLLRDSRNIPVESVVTSENSNCNIKILKQKLIQSDESIVCITNKKIITKLKDTVVNLPVSDKEKEVIMKSFKENSRMQVTDVIITERYGNTSKIFHLILDKYNNPNGILVRLNNVIF